MKKIAIWSPRPDAKNIESLTDDIILYGLPVLDIVATSISAEKYRDLDALIFVSQHAVKVATSQLPRDIFAGKVLIAIGKRTESELKSRDFSVALTAPPPYNSESLLAARDFCALPCQRFGIVCGEGGREKLQQQLNESRDFVTQIACYRRNKIHLSSQVMVKFNDNRSIGGIILSSGDIADAVANNIRYAEQMQFFNYPAFVLSERIAKHAKKLGFNNLIVAKTASRHDLEQCIKTWWEGVKNERQ